MRVQALIIAPLLLAGAAPAQPQQFDLACTGTTKTIAVGDEGERPWSTVFHIDLDKKKWCQDGCGSVYDFYAVQPAILQFKASPEHEAGDLRTNEDEAFVSRTDGTYSAIHTMGQGIDRTMWTTKGSCEKRPFSGFPKFDTKF